MGRIGKRTGATRFVAALGLVTTMLLTLSSTAGAVPPPPPNPSDADLDRANTAVTSGVNRVSDLIVRIAHADQQLAELDAQVAIRREAVNRALVDLQSARDAADAASRAVASSHRALEDAGAQISLAQKDFDAFARDSYTRGSNSVSLAAFLDADGPDDLLDRARIMRLMSTGRTAVLDALERARTREANSHSRARAAKIEADTAAAAAEARKAEAENAIVTARAALDEQAAEKARIEQERATAQSALEQARTNVSGLEGQRAEYQDWDRRRRAEEAAAAAAAEAAMVAASEAATRVAADAAARARAAELANGRRPHTQVEEPASVETDDVATAPETDDDLSVPAPEFTFPETGDPGAAEPGETGSDTTVPDDDAEDGSDGTENDGTDNPDPADAVDESETGTSEERTGTPTTPRRSPRGPTTPSVTGTAAIEVVVDRGLSQIGVPYAWGGGNENGPTRGIRDGGVADVHGDYNKVGFDCSGLMIYAFAGIGISLPHYSGYQYTAGTQVPSSQMRRGDMIFYGPNASQHVALYLGDGQMLEAPQSGSHVKISPVRWAGMTPYVVRMVS